MTVREINGWNRIVPKIDFRTDLNIVDTWQRDREMSLQERAGLEYSTDYLGTRQGLAAQESEAGLADMYTVAENSLKNGANPDTIAKAINSYQPAVSNTDVDVSLEVASAEQQVIDANNTNPKTATNNAVDGIDVAAAQTQNEIFTNWRQDVKNIAQSRPLLRKWSDGVETASLSLTGLYPIFNPVAVRTIFPTVDLSGTYSMKGMTDKIRENLQQARDTMTPQQYHDYLYGMLDYWKSNSAFNWGKIDNILDDVYEGSTYTEDALELAATVDGVVGAARSVYKGYKAAKQVGDINLLRRQARDAMETTDTETIAKEFVTPSAAKPTQNITEVSSDDRVTDMIGDRVSALEAEAYVREQQSAGILDETQLSNLAKRRAKSVREQFNRKNSNVVDVYAEELDSGVVELRSVIGDAEGNALDHDDAVKLAKRLKLKEGEYSIVRKDNEGFFVEAKSNIEDPYGKAIYAGNIDEWTWKGGLRDWFTRHFAGVLKVGKEAHARSVLADRKYNHIIRDLGNRYTHSFYALDKAEKDNLYTIYEKGLEGDGKWFTRDELLNDFGASEKTVDAYFDFKTVQDIEYLAKNEKTRRELVREGYKDFGKDHIIGTEESLEKVYGSNYIIADSDGQILKNADVSTLNPSEYTLVRTARGRSVQDDTVATHILLKKSEANVNELPKFVLNYTPGGRREYANGTVFVKNGRSWYNPTTGNMLNGAPKTLTTSMSLKEAKEYAEEANRAIRIWNSSKTDIEKARDIAAYDFQYFKLENYEHLKQLMRTKENPNGLIDPAFDVQVMEKGGKYTYNNGLETFEETLNDVDWDLQDLLDSRAMYNRNRGNWLDALNGDKARIVDMEEIYDKTMQKAAYTLSKGDLENWYGREFSRFRGVIENWNDIKDLNPREMINAAKVRDSLYAGDTDKNLIRAAERYIMKAKVAFNGRTAADKWVDNFLTKFSRMITGDFGRRRGWHEAARQLNPARHLKALGFWQSMGTFNVSQLWKQGLGTAYVIGAHPVAGNKALMAYIPVRNALSALSKGDTKALNLLKPTIGKITGLKASEVDDMLQYMTKLGARESSGLMIGNEARKGLLFNHGAFQNLWDKQYIFMQEGNALNYYTADITSYIVNKGKSWKEIAQHSDDLFLNMTKSNESAFQRGLDFPTSFMTQWMAYPTRSFEMMFNTRLTPAQRSGMLLSQFLMWGAGGMLGSEAFQASMYTGLNSAGCPDEVANLLAYGSLGALGAEYGIYINEGTQMLSQIDSIWSLFKHLKDGDFELPKIPVLKAGAEIYGMYNVISDVLNPDTGDFDWTYFAKQVAQTKYIPSQGKNLAKAAIMWQLGKVYNTKGEEVATDVETYRAALQALGFNTIEESADRFMIQMLQDSKKTADQFLDDLKKDADAWKFYEYIEGDPEANRQKILELGNTYKDHLDSILATLEAVYGQTDIISYTHKKASKLLDAPENTTDKLEGKYLQMYNKPITDYLRFKFMEGRE